MPIVRNYIVPITNPEVPDSSGGGSEVSTDSIIVKLEAWYEEAKRFREKLQDNRWRKNEKIHANELKTETIKGKTRIKVPLSLIDIRAQKAIIHDFFPSVDLKPSNQESVEHSDIVETRLRNAMDDAHFEEKCIKTIEGMLILGNKLLHVDLRKTKIINDEQGNLKGEDGFVENATEETEIVELVFTPSDARTWYPAPNAIGAGIEEGRYQIFATPMHIDEIKKIYNKKVRPEGRLDEHRVFHLYKDASDSETLLDMALVKECYWMDSPTDEENYKYGRMVIWANGVQAKDEALHKNAKPRNPRYKPGHGCFMLKNYGFPESPFGVGEPEIVETFNKALNTSISKMVDAYNIMGDTRWIALKSWLQDRTRKIKNVPGEVIEVDSMGQVAKVEGSDIPASAFALIDIILKLNELSTAVQDVTIGQRKPGASESGRKVELLQNAAQLIIREKITETINPFVRDVAKYCLFLLQTFDSDIMQMPGSEENDFVEYDPSKIGKTDYIIKIVPGIKIKEGDVETEDRLLKYVESNILGVEDIIPYLIIPDKKKALQNYYIRMGIAEHRQRVELVQAVQEEFEKIMLQIYSVLEQEEGKSATMAFEFHQQKIMDMIFQFPELLLTDAFQILPNEFKSELLSTFLKEEQVVG